jgi:DNA-binding response OmpR family regulator
MDSVHREKRKKILLVDDSPTVLLMERLLLQDEPYEFVCATNGEEAVRLALLEGPDLILMDMVMPKMDGIEACRRLRTEAATCATPIILLMRRDSLAALERGFECACDDYITRPFNGAELRLKVRALLALTSAAVH